jgi:hypothetical protein
MSSPVDISLEQYVHLVAELPLPSKRQKENFADYVSHAHSWYKHLSPYPPGAEFHFYVDKYAGRERKHGTPLVRDRIQKGFHYSQIPTAVYRSAFGYLAYWRGSKNAVPLVVPRTTAVSVRAQSLDQIGMMSGANTLTYGLPVEIFEAGATRLTGAMHLVSAASFWLWDEDRRPAQIDWPEESGGRAVLDKIFERCREIRKSGHEWPEMRRIWPPQRYPSAAHHAPFVDRVLAELLAPERSRQQAEIIKAIDRFCELIESRRYLQHG